MNQTIVMIAFFICFVIVGILFIIGFLLKGERFIMIQESTGKEINVKRGFSFTYFFFGPLVPLSRGHIGGFFLTLFVELFSFGLARLVLLFCYNGMYINWLANNGFKRVPCQNSVEKERKIEKGNNKPEKENVAEFKSCDGLLEPIYGGPQISSDSEDMTLGLTTGKVEAVSGIYQGAVMELSLGEQLTIGRDEKNCNLVINEKEISRKHCEISYDAYKSCYYITDYSTNGIYLGDGSELDKKKSVCLQPGAIVQLGKTQNIFLLKE